MLLVIGYSIFAACQEDELLGLFRAGFRDGGGIAALEVQGIDLSVRSTDKFVAELDRGTYESHLAAAKKEAVYGYVLEAIEDLDKAIEIDSRHPEAYLMRAKLNNLIYRYDAAVKDSSRVIEFDYKSAEGHFERALARMETEDLGGAIEDWDSAAREGAWAQYGRACTKYRRGDVEGAIEDFEEASRKSVQAGVADRGRAALAHRALGVVWRNKGEYRRAKAEFESAIGADARFAGTYFSRGVAFYLQGLWAEALADVNKAYELDLEETTSQDNYKLVAWLIQAKMGKAGEAIKELEKHFSKAVNLVGWTGLLVYRPIRERWERQVARFLSGEIGEPPLFESAVAEGAAARAFFYAGIKRQLNGQTDLAKHYFSLSMKKGNKGIVETVLASAEFEALK